MSWILYILGFLIVAVFLLDGFNRRRIRRLRQEGIYPPPGRGSDGDVERLASMGRKIEAIKLYREIHGVDLKSAKEAVDELARRLPDAR
jgi:hypothetical protein